MSFIHVHVNHASEVPIEFPAGVDELRNTPIHHIWRRAAFREVEFMDYSSPSRHDQPQYVIAGYMYIRMVPALRLASAILERMDYVFERIMFAPVVNPTRFNGLPRAELYEHFPVNDPYYVPRLQNELMELAKTYRIFRHDRFHVNTDNSQRLGLTSVTLVPGEPMAARSAVVDEFIQEISHASWSFRPDSERYATLGLLGVTLVHELAHALWRHRTMAVMEAERALTGTITGPEEPFYHRYDTFSELGTQLEIQLYGGGPDFPLVQGPSGSSTMGFNGKKGLHWSIMSRRGRPKANYILSDQTMRSWFDSSTWKLNSDGTKKTLKIYLLPNPEAYLVLLSPDLSPQPSPRGTVSALQIPRCSCKFSRHACFPSTPNLCAAHSP